MGRRERDFRDAGGRAGNAFAQQMNVVVVQQINQSMSSTVNQMQQSILNQVQNNSTRVNNSIRNGISNGAREGVRDANRSSRDFDFRAFLRAGSQIGNSLHKGFQLGIGRARMGPALRSALLLALPSVISGAGVLGSAIVSQIITSIAAAGPALAGAGGVIVAALSSAALNFGLLFAAFKSEADGLVDLTENAKALGKEFGKPIAVNMLGGMNRAVAELRENLPAINDLLEKSGKQFGGIAENIAKTVTTADNLSRIRGILDTNNSFLGKMKSALADLVTSFLILFNASKPFIELIGNSLETFGKWARSTLDAKEANGELATFMDTLVAAVKRGAQAFGDIVVGIYNIGAAAQRADDGMGGIAARFKEWTSNPENQERMTRFFEKLNVLASALGQLFADLARAAGGALEKMNPEPLLEVLRILGEEIGPALAELWNQVQAGAGENLVKVFQNLADMLDKIAESGTFQKIAEFISGLLVKVTEFLASDFGAQIAAWLIPIGLFGGILTSLVGPLTTVIGLLTGPIAVVAGIIAAIAAAFVLLWTNSEEFRRSLTDLVSGVMQTFVDLWQGNLAPKIELVWEKIQKLASAIGDRLAPVIDFLAPVVSRVFDFIGNVIGELIGIFGGFIDFVTAVLTGNWTLAWDAITQVVSSAWNLIVTVFQFGLSVLSTIWDTITAVIYNAGQVIYGFVTSAWTGIWAFIQMILTAIHDGVVNFGNMVQARWNEFLQWVSETWNTVWTAVSDFAVFIWNHIYAFFEMILTGIADGVRNFGNKVQEIWNSFLNWISETAQNIWNGIWDFITGVLEGIADGIRGFGNTVQEIWNGILEWISEKWNGILETAGAIWQGIADAISGPIEAAVGLISGWVEDIVSVVTGAWETVSGIIDSINSAVSASADAIAATSGSDYAFAPATAEGGIFRPTPGGQLRTIAEAGQAERVEPLDPTGLSQRDHAIINKLAGSGAVGGNTQVRVFIGDRELTDMINVQVERSNDQTARNARNGRF
jgi:phage-related protein